MATNSPIARRLPGFDARHATHRARGVWRGLVVVVVVAAVAAGAAIATVVLRSSHTGHGAASVTSTTATAAVTADVAPWTLRAPIDSEVVLAPPATAAGGGGGSPLEVFGGSTTSHQPASGVFTLDVSNGTLVHVANLTTVLADAAGAVIGGQAVIFGGATPSVVATVQAIAAAGAHATSPVPTATVVGSLPQPRAGAVATTVGATAYVVGGADGTTPDPEVLATTDGTTFSPVASLPVPVAYPAVAAVGTKLFVFGGQALSGAGVGQPVTTVQSVDVRTRRATVVGRLPTALEGAAAVTLGNRVFVVGGDTSSAGSAAVGSAAGAGTSTTPGAQTSGTVWAFDPSHVRLVASGTLQTPVSRAGVAVVGATAWLVGGSSSGAPTSVVQSLTLAPVPAHGG